MFNKVTEQNTIDYFIQSNGDDILMHVVYDENSFITNTYVTFIDEITRDKIHFRHGEITNEMEFYGVMGFYQAINKVVTHITQNKEMGFTDFDIASFIRTAMEDVNDLKDICRETVEDEGFFKNRKLISKYKREYENE